MLRIDCVTSGEAARQGDWWMYRGEGAGPDILEEEQELLTKFLLGQRSLYDVKAYITHLRAEGDEDRARRIERDIILE